MKYCPICEKTYADDVEVCQMDGTLLREAGAQQDPLIGKMIKNRYRVIEKIGEGGMGTVYLAEQVSIGRKVALKILHPEFARDQEFVKRFRQEARLAASLNHRNVITVFDFDQGDDGSLFIAMEYVQGQSLSDVIRQGGPLDLARAVRLGIQIAEGLGAAHRAGVIHRDIKPENIMVVGDAADEIKLMDFGIARLRDTGAATRLTRSGMILGTPVYMAPEQIEGGEVTERTDIYAFGIVLYEMLSGSVPFSAPTSSAVLLKHLQETPIPLRKLRKEIPPLAERAVMHALEKKPDARQHNMDELVEGLKAAERALESASNASSATQRVPTEEGWGGLRSLWKSGELFSRFKRSQSEEIFPQEPKPESGSVEHKILPEPEKAGIGLEQELTPETVLVEKPELPLARQQPPETVLAKKPEAPPARQQAPETVPAEKPEIPLAQQQAPETVLVEKPELPLARQQSPETVLATQPLEVTERVSKTRRSKWKEVSIGVGVLAVVLLAAIGGRYMFFHSGNKERQKPAAPGTRVVGLSIHAQKDTLIPDEQMRLGIKAQFSDGRQGEITDGIEWQSSDPAVAAVSPGGEVIARKEGKAEISGRRAGLRTPPLMLAVKAKEPELPPPPITKLPAPPPVARLVSLNVHADKRELKVNERTALAVEGKYSDGKIAAISQGVEWQSSNGATAEVNSKGEVTAHKEGKVNVTARYAGIAAPAVTLMVKAKEPELPPPPVAKLPPPAPVTRLVSLTVRADKRELKVKERTALAVEGKYSDGKVESVSQGVEWQTSDLATAEVNSKGEVTAQKEGKVNITARYAGIAAPPVTLMVKAKEPETPPAPRLVSLTVRADKRDLKVKERTALAVEGKYSDGKVAAISQGVEWQTSDQTTADVNARGEVTAQREGKVTITARYAGVTSSTLTLSITGDTSVLNPSGVPSEPSKPQPAEAETIKDMRRKVLR